MRMQQLLVTSALLTAAVVRGGDNKPIAAGDAAAAFARLKTLVGHWEGTGEMGKVRLTYELTAGGTVLLERESGEQMPEMLTVYHLDGWRLILTHYCAARNQPRMQARNFDSQTGELRFVFLDATNLQPGAGHMKTATLRMIDDSRLENEWEFHENGQRKSVYGAQYTRVR